MGNEVMRITMAEESAMYWGERLAVWFESLSPKAQELILRILAAMPGGEVLRDYGIVDEDATIGMVEGMILANYMRAALSAGAHVHEEVLRRHFLGEEVVEEEE